MEQDEDAGLSPEVIQAQKDAMTEVMKGKQSHIFGIPPPEKLFSE